MKKCWRLKHLLPIFSLVVTGLCVVVLSAVLPATAAAGTVNVTQHHNNPSRDGLYIDPAFTLAAAANVTRDTSFTGTIVGDVYAQPLYIENGPGGVAMVIAVTESNNVYALNAATGAIIWQRNVGTPVNDADLPCGDINIVGITGTPIVDLPSRSLFLDAETEPSVGVFKHLIYSLNVDTGAINTGWPVDVGAAVSGFMSSVQGERAALGIVGNILYVPYGGLYGDCGSYHGQLVGVQMNNPASVLGWATTATGGGVWGPGGVASDGSNPFVVTGNTFGTGGVWGQGEAVIRLQPGPVFSGSTNDYWAPANWSNLDDFDLDLGGSGAILVDVPGATPSALVVALGKDGNAYLLNRSSLGGISAPVAQSNVNSGSIIQAAATYRTALGTYVVFRGGSSVTTAFRITAANPPTVATGWSVTGQNGRSSPFVTTTDGANNAIVWVIGAEGDQKLHGYNGDTGGVVYAGGGTNELMAGTQRFNTGIAARGRIYIATNNKVYAFNVPASSTPTPTPTPTTTPTPTPTPTTTPTPLVSISGGVAYCSNPTFPPVPGVTMTLTGTSSASTLTNGSGVYTFSSLPSGGNYTVTPSTTALTPGSAGINTLDVIAIQRHFLFIGPPLTGCRQTAADVNGVGGINTLDVIAVQRFFLGQVTGTANVGKYQFTPTNRTYTGLTTNQSAQNYDALVFGDVVGSTFVYRPEGPECRGSDDTSVSEVPSTVAAVTLPEVAVAPSKSNVVIPVSTTEIDAESKLVGFQGDLTFDERVVSFQNPPVQSAGLTAGNWNVSGNVLSGAGPIRTLRISAYSNDFTPLSGSGTLFELRMSRVSKAAQSTHLIWAAPPDDFIFIDADLNTQKPGNAASGGVTISIPRSQVALGNAPVPKLCFASIAAAQRANR